MRYYSIVLRNADGSPFRTYTNFVNGKIDPGALDVEFDIPLAPAATPVGQAFIRVWGVSLQEIAQSPNLNGKGLKMYGGMKPGLPLANPAQAGLLVSGSVQQAFANWLGTEQTLDLYVGPPQGKVSAPANIVFDWRKGTSLSAAIQATLARAFPGTTFSGRLNPSLVLPHDEQGFYPTLDGFAGWLKQETAQIVGNGYPGVDLVQREQAFAAFDGTSQTAPKQLDFKDLIGQPTYRGPNEISVTAVLRGDIKVGDYVKLPPGLVTNSAASLSQYRDTAAFQGVYFVQQPRHVGRLRQPDAASWCTILTVNGPVNSTAPTPPGSGRASNAATQPGSGATSSANGDVVKNGY